MAFGQVTIRDAAGAVVARSRNLRGITDYSRRPHVVVERCDLFPHKKGDGGTLGVTWNNGATCVVDFASYTVMRSWVERRHCFKTAAVNFVALLPTTDPKIVASDERALREQIQRQGGL